MTRPKIGLALGSGAARGWAHIGVIDALTDAGIAPDIVCGTSIGALVGAAHIAGRMAELRQWAEGATWRKIARLTDVRFTGGGPGCTFSRAAWVGLESVPEPPPSGAAFPHGLVDFATTGCTPGGTLEVTLSLPQPLPAWQA